MHPERCPWTIYADGSARYDAEATESCKAIGDLRNGDTIFILSYSIIMLNTDQHNKQVKQKMTLEQFKRNNRGIDDGQSLPDELLEGIYLSIQAEPLKIQGGMEDDEDAYWTGVLKRGTSAGTFTSVSAGSTASGSRFS